MFKFASAHTIRVPQRAVFYITTESAGMILDPFLQVYPASPAETKAASPELLAAYETILPAALLELWQHLGLGFYSPWQFALIDPREWQFVLDRLIVPSREGVRMVPIAVTAFGKILYYRKLTETDEDVCLFNPVDGTVTNLAWSLERCFNHVLCDPALMVTLLSIGLEQTAREQCGTLTSGYIYEVDLELLLTHRLVIGRVEALPMHRRLQAEAASRSA